MGCCTSDPCAQNGCPSNGLRAAILSSKEAEAGPYSAIPDPAATQTPSISSSSSTPSAKQSASGNATSEASSSSTSHVSIGGVVGGIVGGIAVIALIAALAFFLIRRRRHQRRSSTAIALADSDKETPASFFQDSSPYHELETPPPGAWHTPTGKVHELPSPGLGGRQRQVDDEKQLVEKSKNGLGIYTPYNPTSKAGTGTHGLYDEGRNTSYELEAREIDRGSKAAT